MGNNGEGLWVWGLVFLPLYLAFVHWLGKLILRLVPDGRVKRLLSIRIHKG